MKKALEGRKVLLFDLSKGEFGDKNSRIIGSAVVTQIWLSVLQRVKQPENERTRTYMFVDEFQDFASESFKQILSEARKYKLSLVVATQYTRQINPIVWNSIEANVGTFVSFSVGANDAERLSKIYTDVHQDEFIRLQKYSTLVRKELKTSSGTTNALEPTDRNFDEALKHTIDEALGQDDSMMSQLVDWSGDKLNILSSLYYLTLSKKRERFADSEVVKELERRKHPISQKMLENVIREMNTKGQINSFYHGKGYENQITQDGISALSELTGNKATAGGPKHRNMVVDTFRRVTLAGNTADIVPQGGSAPRPDLEINEGEWLNLYSGGKPINVEIESKTTTKPARIIENQKKADKVGRFPVYIAEDREDAGTVIRVLMQPYRVDKDGKYVNYHIDSETECVLEMQFSRPLTEKDFCVLIPDGENGFVRVEIPKEEKSEGTEIKNKTKAVEDFLFNNGGAFTPQYMGEFLGIDPNYVANILGRLRDKGVVEDLGWGLWAHCRWKLKTKGG
jgi:hypothetical protein